MTLNDGWYALHVRPRAERTVARFLEEKGYDLFLPLYKSRRRWSDRVKEIEQPLFPNYLFCRITASSAGRIVGTPGVIRIVGAANAPIEVDECEIDALRLVVAAQMRVEPWPFLRVGQKVAITMGPLTGLEGLLVRIASRERLVLSVSLLQRSVAVEIDGAWVEPVGPLLTTAADTPAGRADARPC